MKVSISLADRLEAEHPDLMEAIGLEIAEFIFDRDHTCDLEEGEDGYVWISDIQAMNACNHVITGVFWIDGVEYSFEAEAGDWNGWLWRMVSADDPVPEIHIHRTVYVLAPDPSLVSKAILSNQGPFLIQKWDAIVAREQFSRIPGCYMYDKHFAPGMKTERYWKDKAAEGQFVLVSKEEADEIRKNLMKAT